jgi:hypothetical protein
MSHIFISYSHHDTKHRDALITELKKENIDFWADTGLEVGTAWREQIDSNLEESFALAVIVTNYSLQSSYVTYEWSWALGHEIPVFPLFFEDITVPIHDRLNAIHQHRTCYAGIPQEVFETIKRYQKQSPLVAYIGFHISQLMKPLQYVVRIMNWLYSYDEDEQTIELITAISSIHFQLIFEYSEVMRNKLPQLWLQNSHSFPREEKKKFQQLTELIDNLASYIPLSDNRVAGQNFIKLWKENIEPVLQLFTAYNDPLYVNFDNKLEEIAASGLPIYDDKIRVQIYLVGLKLHVSSNDKFSQQLREILNILSKEPISENDFSEDGDNYDLAE